MSEAVRRHNIIRGFGRHSAGGQAGGNMSIVALARQRAGSLDETRREPLRGGRDEPDAATGVLENIVSYIPTEAIALYTTGLAFLSHERSLYRWLLVGGVAAFTVALSVVVSRWQVLAKDQAFKWPFGLTATVLFAYAIYVCVIPSSPLNDFGWYGPAAAGIIGVAGNAVLAVVALWSRDPET
jgi:hypothetical protein